MHVSSGLILQFNTVSFKLVLKQLLPWLLKLTRSLICSSQFHGEFFTVEFLTLTILLQSPPLCSIILETDANVIAGKVASNSIDAGAPLSEQVYFFVLKPSSI